MSWDELLIDDLENIPVGYLVSWKFFNAFFLAFQERADYIENCTRAIEYDSLLLDGPQIGATELNSRLSSFHVNVKSCFSGTVWIRAVSYNALKSFGVDVMPSGAGSGARGLGVFDWEEWDEVELKEFLGDDVYDLIFGAYADATMRDSRYWSGLYKLLNNVMLYRSISLFTSAAPNPVTEPYIVANGYKTGFASNPDLNVGAAVSQALSDNPEREQGSTVLRRTFIGSLSSHLFPGVPDENSFAIIAGYTGSWDLLAPTKMNIEFLVFSGQGEALSNSSIVVFNDATDATDVSSTVINNPLSCSINTNIADDPASVYTPNQATFLADKAWNPKFAVGFNGTHTTIDISAVDGVTNNHGVNVSPADSNPNVERSRNDSSATDNYIFNYAIAELPQDDFEF